MVKVAFIVEGKVEQIFIDFLDQTHWLASKKIEKIVILTDLECDPCVQKTKERLGDCDICTIILAKKAIEAWFLADDKVLQVLTDSKIEHYDHPEETESMPYETYKELLLQNTRRGTGSKVSFVTKILKKYHFSIERAANHPHCPSAKYFIDVITRLGSST
jgi:hypothetical protein